MTSHSSRRTSDVDDDTLATTECTDCPVCPEVDWDSQVSGWDMSVGVAILLAFVLGLVMG